MPSNNRLRRVAARTKRLEFRKVIVYLATILIFLFFSFTLGTKGFLNQRNLINIFRQSATTAILAFGMTFVIGSGEIDLSIGSVACISGILAAIVMRETGSAVLAVMVALGAGLLVGVVNGLIRVATALPTFLITIGTQYVVKGFAMWISNTSSIPIMDQGFVSFFGNGSLLGIPTHIIWLLAFMALTYLLMNKVPFGTRTLAVGGNNTAARYSGIRVNRVRVLIMALSGLLAALTGLLYVGRLAAAHYTNGEGIEMSVIAAVVLGGTSMSGGVASIIGTYFGALLMVMLDNGVVLAGMNVSQQMIIKGTVIILATALGSLNRKKAD